jgi:hypothetical protein
MSFFSQEQVNAFAELFGLSPSQAQKLKLYSLRPSTRSYKQLFIKAFELEEQELENDLDDLFPLIERDTPDDDLDDL